MTPEVNHSLGKHEAQIEHLQKNMELMLKDVHEIKSMMSEARGGWRVIVLIAGVSGTVGAFMAKLLPWFAK